MKNELLKKVFISLLDTNLAITEYQKSLTKKKKDIKFCDKVIEECKKAKETVSLITHIEILESLYKAFVNGKESYFYLICRTTNSEKTLYWDTTDDGFQEFLKLEKDEEEKANAEQYEKMKNAEIIAKAKKEGKKIEMLVENGKVKPVIVEDTNKN